MDKLTIKTSKRSVEGGPSSPSLQTQPCSAMADHVGDTYRVDEAVEPLLLQTGGCPAVADHVAEVHRVDEPVHPLLAVEEE